MEFRYHAKLYLISLACKISLGLIVAGLFFCNTDFVSYASVRLRGYCGDNLSFAVTDEGGGVLTLTISGTGDMYDYNALSDAGTKSPWSEDSSSKVNAKNISTIIIEEGVTSIGENAFSSKGGYPAPISFPSTLKKINKNAFTGSNVYGNLIIPEGVTSVGESAFSGCARLNGVISLPSTLNEIGFSAFKGMSKITGRITISNNIRKIPDYAFSGCAMITEVALGKNVESIGNFAFDACGATTLELPSGLRSIGKSAFNKSKLEGTLIVPASVTDIKDSSFKGSALTTVRFLGDAPNEDENAFESKQVTVLFNDGATGFTTPKWHGYNSEVYVAPAPADDGDLGDDGENAGEGAGSQPGSGSSGESQAGTGGNSNTEGGSGSSGNSGSEAAGGTDGGSGGGTGTDSSSGNGQGNDTGNTSGGGSGSSSDNNTGTVPGGQNAGSNTDVNGNNNGQNGSSDQNSGGGQTPQPGTSGNAGSNTSGNSGNGAQENTPSGGTANNGGGQSEGNQNADNQTVIPENGTGTGSGSGNGSATNNGQNAQTPAGQNDQNAPDKYKYTIVFDSNNATGGLMNEILANAGEDVTLPKNKYYKTGYVFLKWKYTIGGNVYYAGDGNVIRISEALLKVNDLEAVKFTAQWSKVQTAKVEKIGTAITDRKSASKYAVTSSKNKTVAYVKPISKNMTSVSIPDTITSKGITYKVTRIDANAFKNCRKLKKVRIGKNVAKIGNEAFYGCKAVASMELGSGLTSIGKRAFYGCDSLKSLTLPSGTYKLGTQFAAGCDKLKTINVKSSKMTTKTLSDGALSGIRKNVTIKVPKAKVSSYKTTFRKRGLSGSVNIQAYRLLR